MPKRKNVATATIIILDIRRNVMKFEKENEKSFFKCARECTVRIIERKILSGDDNYLGIVFIGNKRKLVTQRDDPVEHIEVFSKLRTPTWQMIRNLPEDEEVSDNYGHWYESLTVAADLFKCGVNKVNLSRKKIILVTNFRSSSDFDSTIVEAVINRFKVEEIEVDILSDFHQSSSIKNLDIAHQIVQATGGNSVSFEECMKLLAFHEIKAITSVPTFQVDLTFTSKIKIPISCYIKLKNDAIGKKWKKAIIDHVTKTASSEEAIIKNKLLVNLEKNALVNDKEVIKGYQYGQQIIPFPEYLKHMLYQSGTESLKVYGFTDAKNIDWQHLNSNQMLYVCGQRGNKKARQAIRCLVECLQEQNLIGIARRVSNNNDGPKMFALMPLVDTNKFACLSMVGICYKEEIKYMTFPPTNLKKYQCTEDQLDAFKDLIKAMDLTKAYDENEVDDTEAFTIAETVSPSAQYMLDCIAFRAMNPRKPLPPPREDLMMFFKVPPLIEERSRDSLNKLKNLFMLKEIGEKNQHKNKPYKLDVQASNSCCSHASNSDVEMDDLSKTDLTTLNKTTKITKVGTVDAIHDYETLKCDGKTLDELSPQMTEVIESLIYSNLDGTYSKALKSVAFFRTECINSDPSYYNNWLKQFKLELLHYKKHDVLDLMSSKKLDFILNAENNLSTFESTEQGDSQLYGNDTVATLTNMTISTQVKDFFEDL